MLELPESGTVATMLPAMDGAAVETRNAVMRTTFERVWVMLPHMAHPPFGRKGVRLVNRSFPPHPLRLEVDAASPGYRSFMSIREEATRIKPAFRNYDFWPQSVYRSCRVSPMPHGDVRSWGKE
jgi:hypothetical protein